MLAGRLNKKTGMLWEYSHGGKGIQRRKRWMHKMEQQAQATWF